MYKDGNDKASRALGTGGRRAAVSGASFTPAAVNRSLSSSPTSGRWAPSSALCASRWPSPAAPRTPCCCEQRLFTPRAVNRTPTAPRTPCCGSSMPRALRCGAAPSLQHLGDLSATSRRPLGSIGAARRPVSGPRPLPRQDAHRGCEHLLRQQRGVHRLHVRRGGDACQGRQAGPVHAGRAYLPISPHTSPIPPHTSSRTRSCRARSRAPQ